MKIAKSCFFIFILLFVF